MASALHLSACDVLSGPHKLAVPLQLAQRAWLLTPPTALLYERLDITHLQVVLGTESGMITAIVRRVQQILSSSGRSDVDVEVVFPVASEAITTAQRAGEIQATVRLTFHYNVALSVVAEGLLLPPIVCAVWCGEQLRRALAKSRCGEQLLQMPGVKSCILWSALLTLCLVQGANGVIPAGESTILPEGLSVVPGVAAGEGCSAEGGCASCPYMKMNTLACALTPGFS